MEYRRKGKGGWLDDEDPSCVNLAKGTESFSNQISDPLKELGR